MLELLAVTPSQATAEPATATQVDVIQAEQVIAPTTSVSNAPAPIAAPESISPESVAVTPSAVTASAARPTISIAVTPPDTGASSTTPLDTVVPGTATVSTTAIPESISATSAPEVVFSAPESAPESTDAVAATLAPDQTTPDQTTSDQTLQNQVAQIPTPEVQTDNLAARRQLLEQRLSEIVKRKRQAIAERQQKITELAMQYATSGQFDRARELAQNSNLPPAIQADLVARLQQLEGDKPGVEASPAQVTLNSTTNLPYPIEVLAIMRAIVTQESSGNFKAVNPHSGALGFAQIMPENLPSWSQEALGKKISRSAFLNSPAIQLQIIAHRLNKYWQYALSSSSGDESIAVRMVASLWYSGKAHLFNSYARQFYGGVRYPAIAEYTLAVLQRYQREKQNLTMSS